MFYKHNYKKEEEEEKKEEGFLQKLFQKLKEISFYSYMLSFLIAVLLLILFLIYLEKRSRDLKVPQTVVKTQLVSKEKFSKNEEISMNETSKLNESNFEVFVSKKVPNKGIILLKYTDFINNNNKIILYKATKKIKISGNPEILKKLNVSISTNNKMNFNTESINIELDPNQKNNSILSLELNSTLLDKEQILENNYIVTVAYEESYVE